MLTISGRRSTILATDAYRFAFARALRTASRSCLLISAYVTKAGIEWLSQCHIPDGVQVSIVARWSASDLLSGASDFEAYWLARQKGWSFRVLSDLHAKSCLIDDGLVFLGSANITGRGLSLVPGGNRELGVCMEALAADRAALWGLFNAAVPLNDDLVRDMMKWSAQLPRNHDVPQSTSWPQAIAEKVQDVAHSLWVADLPWCSASELVAALSSAQRPHQRDDVEHDCLLFQCDSAANLASNFRVSRSFLWLVRALQEEPSAFAYYGRLAERLHSAVLDDPTPYRKDIKQLLSNLLGYCRELAPDLVEIDKPSYSQRVRLK